MVVGWTLCGIRDDIDVAAVAPEFTLHTCE